MMREYAELPVGKCIDKVSHNESGLTSVQSVERRLMALIGPSSPPAVMFPRQD